MKFIKPILIIVSTAIITHLLLIIYWANNSPNSPYLRVAELLEVNKFHVVNESFGKGILQFESQDLRYGVCHYALNEQALILNATINNGFGIVTVYSQFGEALFSINSRQTKMENLRLALLLEGAPNNLPDGLVFHRIKSSKGMVVVRLATSDQSYNANVELQLKMANCQVIDDVVESD